MVVLFGVVGVVGGVGVVGVVGVGGGRRTWWVVVDIYSSYTFLATFEH